MLFLLAIHFLHAVFLGSLNKSFNSFSENFHYTIGRTPLLFKVNLFYYVIAGKLSSFRYMFGYVQDFTLRRMCAP
jgi:hypothetical protein